MSQPYLCPESWQTGRDEDQHLIQDQRPEGPAESLRGRHTALIPPHGVYLSVYAGRCSEFEESPGPLVAGDIGPDRDWLLDPAGDGEGEGEGPVRAGGGSRGETWGEKGERAGVPWSP